MKIHDFSLVLLDFHGKSIKNHGFSLFRKVSCEFWVSISSPRSDRREAADHANANALDDDRGRAGDTPVLDGDHRAEVEGPRGQRSETVALRGSSPHTLQLQNTFEF